MKTRTILFLMVMMISTSLAAQTAPESVKVSVEQVPALVKQAYEKEYGTLKDEGEWKVRIVRITDNGRVKATPLWYSYTRRSKEGKLELRFTPEGTITSSKGKPGQELSHDSSETDKTGSN